MDLSVGTSIARKLEYTQRYLARFLTPILAVERYLLIGDGGITTLNPFQDILLIYVAAVFTC